MTWYHLLLDFHGCDLGALNREEVLKEVFERLSRLMDLQIIAGPIIVRYVGREDSPSGEGLSGFMVVAESHVSIHTDVRTGYASIDVYSCKKFDSQLVEEYLIKTFKPQKILRKMILRGVLEKEAEQPAIE